MTFGKRAVVLAIGLLLVAATPTAARAQDENPGLSAGSSTTYGASSLGISESGGQGQSGLSATTTIDPSTGTAHVTIPFNLPRSRGRVQPSLAVVYSSTGKIGAAGPGWDLNLPAIVRYTIAGPPRFNVAPPMPAPQANLTWDPGWPANGGAWPIWTDRFMYDGEPLVPVCLIGPSPSTGCANLQVGETLPAWSAGWLYFRLEHEHGYSRFFYHGTTPFAETWVVEETDGTIKEFGEPLDSPPAGDGVAVDFTGAAEFRSGGTMSPAETAGSTAYRWNLVRQYDAQGPSVNRIEYHWTTYSQTTGEPSVTDPFLVAYLSDIYDTPSTAAVSNQSNTAWGSPFQPGDFAHHTHLTWVPADAQTSPPGGLPTPIATPILWRTVEALNLARVDVTSAPFAATGAKSQVRSYALAYLPDANTHSPRGMLSSVTATGECPGNMEGAPVPNVNGFPVSTLSSWTCTGATLPPTTMTYTSAPLTPHAQALSPTVVAETYPLLADVNGDGLPDVVIPAIPCNSGNSSGGCPNPTVMLNSIGGTANTLSAAQNITVQPWYNLAQTTQSGVFAEDVSQGFTPAWTLGNWAGGGVGTLDVMWLDEFQDVFNTLTLTATSGQGSSATGWTLVPQTPKGFPPPEAFLFDSLWPYQAIDVGETQFWSNVDVDGDGFLDMIRINPNGSSNAGIVTFFSGAAANNSASSPWWINPGATAYATGWATSDPAESATTFYQNYSIVDVTGDGAPDLVRLPYVGPGGLGQLRVQRGWGTGYFDPSYYVLATIPANLMSDFTGDGGEVGGAFAKWNLHDLNGDGLADLVVLGGGQGTASSNGVDVYFSSGHGFPGLSTQTPTPDVSIPGTTIPGWNETESPTSINWGYPVQFLDMNGDGIDDVVFVFSTKQASPQANPPPAITYQISYVNVAGVPANGGSPVSTAGLLTSIANGYGATTTLAYDSIADLQLQAAASTPWTSTSAQALRVVTSVTTTANGGPKGTSLAPIQTRYSYSNPVYDKEHRAFRGFQSVTTTKVQSSNQANNLVTQESYLIGGPTCSGRTACQPSSADEPQGALASLPTWSLTSSGTGSPLTATHRQFEVQALYAGLDGRGTRSAVVQQTDTYVFSPGMAPLPNCGSAPPGCSQFTDVVDNELSGVAAFGPITNSYPLGTTSKLYSDIRQQTTTSRLGDITSVTNFGVYSVDTPIATTHQAYYFGDWGRAEGDVVTAYGTIVAGSNAASGPPRHIHYAYDGEGNMRSISGDLSGGAALVRANPGGSTAAAPANALPLGSTSGLMLSYYTPDPYGNLASEQSGDTTRETDYAYDPVYAQLQTQRTDYPQGKSAPTSTFLSMTILKYDRGLGLPTIVTDSAGATTTAGYDPFGRLSSLFRPDPSFGSSETGAPNLSLSYKDPPGGPFHRVDVTELTSSSPQTFRHRSRFTDALGRAAGAVADGGEADSGQFVATGFVNYDSYGRVVQAYLPFFTTTNPTQSYPSTGSTPARAFQYDALGRATQVTDIDGTVTASVSYNRLAKTVEDANTVAGVTAAPVTMTHDGHGRTSMTVQATSSAGGAITTTATYLATGETVALSYQSSTKSYSRTWAYDSLGHLVQNMEPNSSSATQGWVYAYDVEGELVGTSDARGCGTNLTYDLAGRLVAKDFSPCVQGTQPTYTLPVYGSPAYQGGPSQLTGDGTEVFYVYDSPESGEDASLYGGNASFLHGHLVASYSRGEHTQYGYDGRGRGTAVKRWLGAPNAASQPELSARYALSPHRRDSVFDEVGRPTAESSGSDVSALSGTAVEGPNVISYSAITTAYDARDIPFDIGGSYGTLVGSEARGADGRLLSRQYKDVSQTLLSYIYGDARQRLTQTSVSRVAGAYAGAWVQTNGTTYSSPVSPNAYTTPAILQSTTIAYDANNNPTSVLDNRYAPSWETGYKPVNPKGTAVPTMAYDDLNRLTQASYSYGVNVDAQVTPYNGSHDPPPLPFVHPTTRATSQSYAYDSLGNITTSDDNLHAFLERSSGVGTYGTASAGPEQLQSGVSIDSGGDNSYYDVAYDAAGNVIGVESVIALASGTILTNVLTYDWDEVGELSQAVRTDRSRTGTHTTNVDSFTDTFAYDSTGRRTWRSSNASGSTLYWAEVFSSLRLNAALWVASGATGDYEDDEVTETVYLTSGAGSYGRVVYDAAVPASMPQADGNPRHVFLQISDPRGSATSTVDAASGELVEQTTYQPFGATETDFRPARWDNFRESYRYTGKEDDYVMGLAYFGARYYLPMLQRWASPDPLAIHARGGNPNPYAFAANNPMKYRDPDGLDDTPDSGVELKDSGPMIVGYVSADGRWFAPLGENEVRVWGGKDPLIPIYANGVLSTSSSRGGVQGDGGPINGHGNASHWYDQHGRGAFRANGLGQVKSNPYAEFPAAAGLFGAEGRDTAYDDELNRQSGMAAMEIGVTVLVPEVLPELLGGIVATEGGTAAIVGSSSAAEGAVTVTQEGLAAVGEHLAQFGEYAPNTAMLDRLGGQVGSAVTGADANFYTHELLEAGHMASGMSYDAAHAAALEQAGVSPFSVFHPEVIQQFPAQFNNAWRAFWGL